jgi:hypothetical protein
MLNTISSLKMAVRVCTYAGRDSAGEHPQRSHWLRNVPFKTTRRRYCHWPTGWRHVPCTFLPCLAYRRLWRRVVDVDVVRLLPSEASFSFCLDGSVTENPSRLSHFGGFGTFSNRPEFTIIQLEDGRSSFRQFRHFTSDSPTSSILVGCCNLLWITMC